MGLATVALTFGETIGERWWREIAATRVTKVAHSTNTPSEGFQPITSAEHNFRRAETSFDDCWILFLCCGRLRGYSS